MVNEIFRCAKLRNPRDPQLRPFYFYIDEFAQFITRDIARALEEARKFRLNVILAHQHLAQLREEDDYLYASVLTNCKNKVVFGGLSREDATTMADEIATGFVNVQAVKDEVYATRSRQTPELRTVRQWSESQGESHSHSESASASQSHGSSSGSSYGRSGGLSYRADNGGDPRHAADPSGHTTSEQFNFTDHSSHSSSESHTTTSSSGSSRSASRGESETWVSVTKEYQELSSRTFWTLAELEYMQMATLKNQAVAQAFIKLWGEPPRQVQIASVESAPWDEDSAQKLDTVRQAAFTANAAYFADLDTLQADQVQRQTAVFGEVVRFTKPATETLSPSSDSLADDDDPFT